MKSLAEALGVIDPKQPDKAAAPAPSKKISARTFAREILHSPEYRESLMARIIMGELPPAVECLLYHYAHGKPVEKVEYKDVSDPVDDYTAEQCEERASRLLEFARQLRTQQDEQESTDDDVDIQRSIH